VQFDGTGEISEEDVDTVFAGPQTTEVLGPMIQQAEEPQLPAVQQTAIEPIQAPALVGEVLPPEMGEIEFLDHALTEYRESQPQPIMSFEVSTLIDLRVRQACFSTLFERDPKVVVDGSWDKVWSVAKNRFEQRIIDGRVMVENTNLKYIVAEFEGQQVMLSSTEIRYALFF